MFSIGYLCPAISLFFISGLFHIASAVHYSYQSGADGFSNDSFGNSLQYDSKNDLVYVTGVTYSRFWDGISSVKKESNLKKSDCFFAVLNVPQEGNRESHSLEANDAMDNIKNHNEKGMELVHASRFGKEDISEVCSEVAFMPSVGDKTRLTVLGQTEEGGLMTALRTPGSRKSSVYGMLLEFDVKVSKKQGKLVEVFSKFEGGRLLHDHLVQYPVAVTSDPLASQTKEMHVALLTSPIRGKKFHGDIPDLETISEETKRGGDFRITLQMLKQKSQAMSNYEEENNIDLEKEGVRETLIGGWERSMSPRVIEDTPDVHLSGFVYIPQMLNGSRRDILVLTGTTSNSRDPEFGGTDLPLSGHYGFVTKFLPDDGKTDNTFKVTESHSATATVGVANSNDSIEGICFQKGSDNVDYIYVVGITTSLLDDVWMNQNQLSKKEDGKISKHAFLAKLRLSNLKQVWARQLGSENGENVLGHGCEVTPDGDAIYMAGTIESGGTIRLLSQQEADVPKSAGGDDIFIASYSEAGDIKFARQFGTSEHDRFAKGRGIVSDENGNAIVLGNTRGSMARVRDETDDLKPHDIFIMSVGRDQGKMRETAEKSPQSYATSNASISSGFSDSYGTNGTANPGLDGVEIIAIVFSSLIMFLTILYAGCSVRKPTESSPKKKWRNNDGVMQYVEDFNDDVVELHVRHSATGGVHGIYDFVSKKGGKYVPNEESVGFKRNENVKSDRDSSTPVSNNSSTSKMLEDALFIADGKTSANTKAQRNSEFLDEDKNASESYTGVVESYNTSWKERSQFSMDGVDSQENKIQGPKKKVHEDDNIWGDTEII